MTIDKDMELDLNEKLQVFLMDFEAALFQRCKHGGQLIKKDWSPQHWANKLESLIQGETVR